MKSVPFRLKIALLSVVISGAVLLAFGVATWLLASRQKLESVDTEIRALGARHPGWFSTPGNYQRLDEALAFIFGEAHDREIILMVKDASGTVQHTSAGWPADLDPNSLNCRLVDDPDAVAMSNPQKTSAGLGRGRGGPGRGLGPGGRSMVAFTKVPRFETVTTTSGEWRIGMLGTADSTLVIGLNYAPMRAELNRLRDAFLVAWCIALGLVGGGGWWLAGRALRPLRTIADTAERVTASGLDQRIPVGHEDSEIARVIRVLNRMMDRLETSFRQATRFSADASHELKTPLAIMQGELENAVQTAVPGSSEQQFFANLLEETQRLTVITRSLLLLAQADAGQLKLAIERCDFSEALTGVIEDAQVLAVGMQLNFDCELQSGLGLDADRALLHTALFNLISNAVKYNEPGGRVEIRVQRADGRISCTIGNTGPGIPAADQPRIFERFFQSGLGDRRRRDGIGLGLSLVTEIVRAHGGELILKESRPGWTCFRLTLPDGLQR